MQAKMKHGWVIFIFLFVFGMVVIGLRIFTAEDNWLCENGQWVRHGNPTVEMPEQPCLK